jgi:Tfp pilus assembly protein PilO
MPEQQQQTQAAAGGAGQKKGQGLSSSITPRTLMIFAIVGIALVQVLVVVLVLVPVFRTGAETNQKVSEEQARQTQLQQQITDAKSQASQMSTLQAQLTQLQGELPGAIDQEGFLRSINGIVGANGVQLSSINWKDPITFADFKKVVDDYPIQPSSVTADQERVYEQVNAALAAAANDSRLQAVPVSITVKGGYENMAGFISAAQHLDRIYWVNGVNINRESGDDANSYTAVLSGYTFIRPES